MNNRLYTSQRCALAAKKVNGISSFIRQSIASRDQGRSPLLSTDEVTPREVSRSGLPSTRDMDILESPMKDHENYERPRASLI